MYGGFCFERGPKAVFLLLQRAGGLSVDMGIPEINALKFDLEKLKADLMALRSGSCPAAKPPIFQPDPAAETTA
jgi:hypothetical protein